MKAQTKDHHLQTRMARKLANGNYLVPQLLDKVVREYTPKGEVVWEVKTPDMPFTAIRLPDGNTLIGCTLGNLVIEVDSRGETVWRLTNDDLPGRPIKDACGVQRLPNGNTVITSYHAMAGEVKLLEVTPERSWSGSTVTISRTASTTSRSSTPTARRSKDRRCADADRPAELPSAVTACYILGHRRVMLEESPSAAREPTRDRLSRLAMGQRERADEVSLSRNER